MSRRLLTGLVVFIGLLPLLLGIPSSGPSSLQYRFVQQSSPHATTIAGWMAGNLVTKIIQSFTVASASQAQVSGFFSLADRYTRIEQSRWAAGPMGPAKTASLPADLSHLRAELDSSEPAVEQTIQKQVADAIEAAGVGHRLPGTGNLVPPVMFKIEPPPLLLVVSPRDKIERLATVLLDPHLTPAEMERLEDQTAGTKYSTLVTQIGGLGVYPSILPETSDVRWMLRTVAHEWAHQYLALCPLGWRYAFGAENDGRMVTVNESVADIVGREIGDAVYRQYYDRSNTDLPQPSSRTIEFKATLRSLRIRVDALLATGNVDEAESLMEQTRLQLVDKGYSIRKLNQAYFAFYGSYADDPYIAGPQGEDIASKLHTLRAKSQTLGDFVSKVASSGSYDDLSRLTATP